MASYFCDGGQDAQRAALADTRLEATPEDAYSPGEVDVTLYAREAGREAGAACEDLRL